MDQINSPITTTVDAELTTEDFPRVKRFKHQSYNASLKEVHLPSALSQSSFDRELADDESHFHESIDDWRQLNLSPAFLRFASKADSLSLSMPLLLHNWREIVEHWLSALEDADDEALKALLDLLQKLAHDLRTTLSPVYSTLLTSLLSLLPRTSVQISAPSLTALLSTLSSLFKYLLIPSLATAPELLDKTWKEIRTTLEKCRGKTEVQRALGEVWGVGVMRRLKVAGREQVVGVMLGDGNTDQGGEIQDACAWMFVSACKSVSQTMHTSTTSIISPLLSYYLTSNAIPSEQSYTLLRRVLTALIHHVKSAEQFAPLGDLLVEKFVHIVSTESGLSTADAEQESLRRILTAVSVVCSVRQGSRMSQTQLRTLATSFPFSLDPIPACLFPSLLKYTTSILIAGDMSIWLGPGRKILAHTLQPSLIKFGITLHGALADAELEWGGWKGVGIQGVLKVSGTGALLDGNDAGLGLAFLARLVREGTIGEADVDLIWKERVGKVVDARLQDWTIEGKTEIEKQGSVEELNDLLALAPFVSTMSKHLVSIIDVTLNAEDTEAEYEQTYANSAWVLGECMGVLAKRLKDSEKGKGKEKEKKVEFDLPGWVRKAVGKWSWSNNVLSGLVALVRACPTISDASTPPLPLADLYPSLKPSLLSHSRALRLSVLRLLSSTNLVSSSQGEQEVLKRCLQGEEVPLDVQGVRERVLRIGRVGQVVREHGDGADICVRWLVAQLKVNLRPLWSPAAGALASLSQRFGDLVWEHMFGELQAISGSLGVQESGIPDWTKVGSADGDDDDEPMEEERSWRDPSAHKIRSAVGRWVRDDYSRKTIIQDQTLRERLDRYSYESQLLFAIGECRSLAEKHNRDLVPLLISFAGPDSTSKLSRHRLTAWLTLFSKFTNPKAFYSADIVHSLHLSLLSHGDRVLQRLALTCVLNYKSPHLSQHEDRLIALLDDTRWREELTSFDVNQLQPQDRPEVVEVAIRLFFGMMIEKRGRTRGADRRAAILGTLASCTEQELGLLVDLMLSPLRSHSAARREHLFLIQPLPKETSEKQQVGFLTLLRDVMQHLGSHLVLYWPALLGTTIDLIANAQNRIQSSHQVNEEEELDTGADEDEGDEEEDAGSISKKTRSVRQLGLKRFADFFRHPISFNFKPFMAQAFQTCISPRLPALDKENIQAPSAMMELLYSWTLEREHVEFLFLYDPGTLPQIYGCLIATNVKPTVISRIFDLIDRVLSHSVVDESVAAKLVKPHVSLLLTNLAILVERNKGTAAVSSPLGQRQIGILSEIAQYLTNSSEAATLLALFSPLLRKPSKFVTEKVKVNMLKIIVSLLPIIPDVADASTPIFTKTYDLLSRLFQSLRSSQARKALVESFRRLAELVPVLDTVSKLMVSLNAYSNKRIEEPDFDHRLEAFGLLNDKLYDSLSARDWLPILYNMLSFIQDADELAIRNNASFTLRHFIDLIAVSENEDFNAIFTQMLYPGLKNGLRSRNEAVRIEVMSVVAYAVTKCERIDFLKEMRVLLAGGDEEADFFNNIHHVQIHRRTRALRRLAEYCDGGHLRSTTLADIFVPLVSNYIATPATVDHHLVNEAIVTMGRMAHHLAWGAYYALVQKFLKLSRERNESERVHVRTLVAVLENFHFAMEEVVSYQASDQGEEPEADADDQANGDSVPISSATVPHNTNFSKIADAVNLRLLPNLLHHLEKRDVTEDGLRIPISIGIVRVAKHLPTATREPQISRLITILSQILRSKSQETRDLTRDTFCRITVILGPSYLAMILRELRAALLRGPHLHVLAYVAHALLVHVSSAEHSDLGASLDACVADAAHVSAEVIFGESGKDVRSEDFKTKMREVRSSSAKGLDSFAVMAKYITPSSISGLLLPLRSILQETQSLKSMQLVEEVLRRIAGGLNSNQHMVPAEVLVLCHTLITQNAKFLQDAPTSFKSKSRAKRVNNDAVVQNSRNSRPEEDHYSNNSFRFVVFGLDLFNTAFRRGRFDFSDADIMARLEPMVPVIGNTLYSNNAFVISSGMKAAAMVVKAPLKSIEKSLPVLIRQIIDIVKQTGSTESDTVQMAFKSLATILRDCAAAQVKEKDLIYLLELASPDLEETSRQGPAFAILRAIIARKFVVPEIYDIMDKVSEIMVTNQSHQVQELCRSVLLQFLLDFPQGKGRLRNNMTFMAKNLSYVHESGRKSVMELLSAVVAKFEVGLVREYADLLFVALVMVVANDESAKCREMAAELIKNLFTRLDDDRRKLIMSHLHSWASQWSQRQLTRVSIQVYGIVVDTMRHETSLYLPTILADANAALKQSVDAFDALHNDTVATEDMELDMEWQVPYHALTLISKILQVLPDLTAQSDRINWDRIVSHLLFPHAWVRSASCKLLGLLFNAVPTSAPSPDLPSTSPFSYVGMREIGNKLCLQLKSQHLDAPLSLQVVKNLLYIGKCFYAVPLPSNIEVVTQEALTHANDDNEETPEDLHGLGQNPLPWLFSKLSYQARSAHIARRNRSTTGNNWSHQILSVLKWFAAMASFMDTDRVQMFLVHILTPVYRITEDDTIRDTQMEEVKAIAVELQDMIQAKVGVTSFANVYSRIRQNVLTVRRDRKTARATQAVTNPEAAAQRRVQKNAVKKDSRKRKNASFADNKGRLKRRREE